MTLVTKRRANQTWNYLIRILQRHRHILSIVWHLRYQWPWISLRGHSFLDQSKVHVWLPIRLQYNLGPILPRYRDIIAFVRRKPLFPYASSPI